MIKFTVSLFITLLFITPLQSQAQPLTEQQRLYKNAQKALNNHDTRRYNSLRKKLNQYPLAIYLDFEAHIDSYLNYSGNDAKQAFSPFKGSPLYNKARSRYLTKAGKAKRWQDFLIISPTQPNNLVLQCYFYRAKLSQKKTEVAFKGAKQLWLHGHSRPKACDPLFNEWIKAGNLSQALIWQRMVLSFEARQWQLLKYLSNKITDKKSAAKQLLKVYQTPSILRKTSLFIHDSPSNRQIIKVGLKRLSRQKLAYSIKLFDGYQKTHRFSEFEVRELQKFFVRRILTRQDAALKSYADKTLASLDSDDLIEQRLRWAIRNNQHQDLQRFLPLLSEETANSARWRYWSSRLPNTSKQAALTTLTSLSHERNFYGFLAAKQLKKPFETQNEKTKSIAKYKARLFEDSGLKRVIEFIALNKEQQARSEWVLLLKRHDPNMQKEYAVYAANKGWHSLGVQASIQAKLWNDMALRFPFAAQKSFKKASKRYRVNIDDLRAISRRESAFFAYATSGAGARGYMQLMPATAKQTAKKERKKYTGKHHLFQADLNITLGSAYFSSLLKQFNNNRVLATASYNAGPNRIKSWLKKSRGKLDTVSFIESIPFKETREYVQAVLSYRVIYQVQQNKKANLFSKQELEFSY